MAMARFDRISTLPDGVLCHILSFLPTKEAVATSVLSNRWNSLWLLVPSLHFSDENTTEETYHHFEKFVYSVLLARAASTQPIKEFCLLCGSLRFEPTVPTHVRKWVNFVLQRGVEHLQLEMSGYYMHRLPRGILSCRTLVSLKLLGFWVEDVSSAGLPSLKTLRLESLRFREARHILELISVRPNLEELEALALEAVKDNSNTVTSAELKSFNKLTRACMVDCVVDIPLEAIHNVEFLQMGLDEVDPGYNVFPTFHNLIHLEIVFKQYHWHFLLDLLQYCPKLQVLILDNEANKNYEDYWVEYPKSVPECLSLHLRACKFRDFQGVDSELEFARYVMQNASVLGTMQICSTMDSDSYAKLEMIKTLSWWERRSATCRLDFE